MRSRWDIQDYPPDILITNYSMLNIMLLRERDQSIFEKTVQWLSADASHVFTIVVDELHMYRGTPGTEVAYLLRNLLLRLNLFERPEQVRFIAASASLEKNVTNRSCKSLRYVADVLWGDIRRVRVAFDTNSRFI